VVSPRAPQISAIPGRNWNTSTMNSPEVDGLRALELGTPGPMRQRLNGLVLKGKKRATAGTLDEYVDNEKEFVGELLALVDDDLTKVATVRVTETREVLFGDVPWSFAQAEGEGHVSIDEWRESHRRYWSNEGVLVRDTTPIFLLNIELVEGPSHTQL
jgi:uncharacterized protein YhfF